MPDRISRMTTRWGVMGTGGIANQFATDLALADDAQIVAVGSRTQESADAFAQRFDIPGAYDSYAALADDPDVDAVYVATPHPVHRECALTAIAARKAVLVEKPFTLNAIEAEEVVAAARATGTFLMEAMWTRFLPHIVRVRELVAAGRLGQVRSVQADFGERFPLDPTHRAYAPELGGGSLLDLGVYPVSFASMILGAPERVAALSNPAPTGVDSQTGVLMLYRQGEIAILFTSLESQTGNTATVSGTKGRIEIQGDFLAPSSFRVVAPDGGVEEFTFPHRGRGLRHQATEVARCLRAGLTESPVLPLDETLDIIRTLDEVRRQIGLRYPQELSHDVSV